MLTVQERGIRAVYSRRKQFDLEENKLNWRENKLNWKRKQVELLFFLKKKSLTLAVSVKLVFIFYFYNILQCKLVMDNRQIVSPVMISLCCDWVHRTSPLPPLIYIPPCSRMKVPLESQCLSQPVSPSSVRLAAPDSPRLPLFIPSKVRQWLS